MLARGFDVTPTDGSPEMAEIASRRLGRPVGTLLFHDLDAVEAYDGVWANACLLHVPRDQLAGILALIHRALKPGGAFYASYKTGEGDGRDTLNRYYNYPTEDWLRATYAQAGEWTRSVDRDRRGEGLRRCDGRDVLRSRPQGAGGRGHIKQSSRRCVPSTPAR